MNDELIIAKYAHGSEDSTDTDVHYVFREEPAFKEAKAFCDEDRSENRNVITIKDGVVDYCYKGSPDEVNNALMVTYGLHVQGYPLLITRLVERNKPLKYIRAVRGILSHLSRTQYRPVIKAAMTGPSWTERLNALDTVSLHEADFSKMKGHLVLGDVWKIVAFQIGQSLGLLEGVELYTKSDIAERYPELKPFLYRDVHAAVISLDRWLHRFTRDLREKCPTMEHDGIVTFVNEGKKFDVKYEKEV